MYGRRAAPEQLPAGAFSRRPRGTAAAPAEMAAPPKAAAGAEAADEPLWRVLYEDFMRLGLRQERCAALDRELLSSCLTAVRP